MLEEIEAGNVSAVIIKDMSRAGRDYLRVGLFMETLKERDVRLIAVNDGVDSIHGYDDFIPFRNIINEMYAKDISKKVRSVRSTSAKQGKFMGSKPPFGYDKSHENKHQLIVDAPAAEIVKRLFREFAQGQSGRAIADGLNYDGVDTPAVYYFKQTGKRSTRSDSGNLWGSNTVIQLLKNQAYTGDMVQCKRKVSSFKTKKRLVTDPEDWVIVENTHEAIVDQYTWDCVQRRLDKAKRTPAHNTIRESESYQDNLFSGIIRCADCGASMAFVRKPRKSRNDKMIYRCSRYNNNGKTACSTHTIDAEVLESVILADIQHHADVAIKDGNGLLDKLMSYSGQEQRNKKAAQEKVLRDASSRIEFIESASKRLFEEKISGNVPDSLFKKMFADYEKELSELEETASGLRRMILDGEQSEAEVIKWMDMIKDCAYITKLDRATAYQLIDHVAIHEQEDENGHTVQTVQIKYNFVGCLSQ